MTNAITLSSICNRVAIPANQQQLIYTLTELRPGEGGAGAQLPMNFCLVLDHSGSMCGERLESVKEASKFIVDQLQPTDVVSVVIFESRTTLVVDAQLATDKQKIKKKIDSIDCAGGTTMAPAIKEAMKQVQKYHNGNYTSRIVVLTDGQVGDEQESFAAADQAGAKGIPIIGLGFGTDWEEEFLMEIADRSLLAPGSETGSCEYIASPQDVQKIFMGVYQSMQVVARNVRTTLRVVQGVEVRRVWQVVPMINDITRNTAQGQAVDIPVGDLEKNGAAYMVEMLLPPRPAGQVRVAQVDATYEDQDASKQRVHVDLLVNYSADPTQIGQNDPRVMGIVDKVQAHKLQTIALRDAEQGNREGATVKLKQAVTILLNQGEVDQANQLQQEVNNLEQQGQISEEGKKTIKLTSKKTVKL